MAKDRCTQTRLSARNQKRIAASFFPNETGASINACTQGKKGRQKQKKKIAYLANRNLYTRLSNVHPLRFSNPARGALALKRNKDQSVILRILRLVVTPQGEGKCVCVRVHCDEIDGTWKCFIGGTLGRNNTGCTYALINHRLDAPPVSRVNPCKLLNEAYPSLPLLVCPIQFSTEVSRNPLLLSRFQQPVVSD